VLPVTGGDSGNGGQHNSDNQLDEHEGCVHADLKYRRFTCNRVVTTVMMASTTVTTSWISTKGLMKTFFSGKIISTSAMGTSEKDLITMLRCAMPCSHAEVRVQSAE